MRAAYVAGFLTLASGRFHIACDPDGDGPASAAFIRAGSPRQIRDHVRFVSDPLYGAIPPLSFLRFILYFLETAKFTLQVEQKMFNHF